MRSNDSKYKEWKIRRDYKKFLHNLKRKRKRKQKEKSLIVNNVSHKKRVTKKVLHAPQNFSIINNSKETISFFNNFKNIISDCKTDVLQVKLDMSMITQMTVDALIYLIAIIKNIRKTDFMKFEFSGNLPADPKCRNIVIESGFLDHMKSTKVETIFNQKKLRIRSGNDVDPDIIRDICCFVQDLVNVTKQATKKLYGFIGELMNNATSHAYSEKSIFAQKWLLYVENIDDKFKFTFLDTGLGIPHTMNKKLSENIFKDDCFLVKSALDGQMRSATKKSYRNKGLPLIKDTVKSGYISKLNIISNKACCELFDKDENDIFNDFITPLNGTLYYWEIKKIQEVKLK